ncbi:hypothetical protein MKX08_005106 [Trichoderma sp. CBMAI-0020]|nr:hypothetical protein MKX08_005106 [Trichoderma sp. CBMAI-0020]
MNRLVVVRDGNGTLQSQYHYDASGKLVCQVIPGKAEYHLYYRGDMLVGFTSGDQQISYGSDVPDTGDRYRSRGATNIKAWVSDGHESVLAWLGNNGSEHHQQYTPYGFSKMGDGQGGPSIGFNGQWRGRSPAGIISEWLPCL